jgi:hypothetical protein
MKYLIIYQDRTAFYTDYYDYENFWSDEIICVIDNMSDKITFDGKTWKDIEYDHL